METDIKSESIVLTDQERIWILEKRHNDMKRGAYWLTPEGRAELKEIFDDPNDQCSVRTLLDALEKSEEKVACLSCAMAELLDDIDMGQVDESDLEYCAALLEDP